MGNEYTSLSNVPLYDENGNKYFRAIENGTEIYYVNEYGDKYNINDIYLTQGGYIVNLEDDMIEYNSGVYDAVNVQGEYYYYIMMPYWNKDGDLIVDFMGISKDDSIIITNKDQLEYQKEKNVKLYKMITY